jgi:hypothetical protein
LVLDLLEVLRTIVAKQELALAPALHCMIAAFETLSGPGQACFSMFRSVFHDDTLICDIVCFVMCST